MFQNDPKILNFRNEQKLSSLHNELKLLIINIEIELVSGRASCGLESLWQRFLENHCQRVHASYIESDLSMFQIELKLFFFQNEPKLLFF